MTTSSEARSLLDAILGYGRDEHGVTPPGEKAARVATVDAAFDPTATTGARVTFDGETIKTSRAYPWLGDPPASGSRVVLLPVGRSYVIAGPIGQLVPPTPPAPPTPVLPFRTHAGVVTLPAVNNGTGVTVAAAFPAGRFTRPPLIVATTPSSARLTTAYNNITSIGFDASADNKSGGNVGAGQTLSYLAVQMTPESSAG